MNVFSSHFHRSLPGITELQSVEQIPPSSCCLFLLLCVKLGHHGTLPVSCTHTHSPAHLLSPAIGLSMVVYAHVCKNIPSESGTLTQESGAPVTYFISMHLTFTCPFCSHGLLTFKQAAMTHGWQGVRGRTLNSWHEEAAKEDISF